ncbi:DUF2807 domain-containing protein [Aquimarina sp. RZ0]|nr:DUF2807 domain-containing protein [Aquimarina sp. RZ0]
MKRFVYIVSLFLIFGCDAENAPDCFQRTGTIIRVPLQVTDFKRILVNPNIELIIKEGDNTTVLLETGDNLLEEISATVEGDQLILNNTNDCNFVRSFNQTKIFITAPDITEIRSASQFDISSDGILTYPSLKLLSEDFNENTGTTTGTFNLEIRNEHISVVSNNIASFFIRGSTASLNVTFASGIGRFEGAELEVQNVTIFHRGTNKIIVNPQESIKGSIRSTGDIIAVNRPPIVEVEEFFIGRLIFQ